MPLYFTGVRYNANKANCGASSMEVVEETKYTVKKRKGTTMNIKSKLILLLFCIGIFLAFDQRPCHGTVRRLRKDQEDIMRQAREQISIEPEASREIKREIFKNALEKIETPTARPDSPLRPIQMQISQLLSKEQISPEEIAAVRENLDRVIPDEDQMSEIERLEYENLREDIDMAQGFSQAISELNESHASTMDKLDNKFKQLSGQYDFSFYGNIVLFLGLITKLGNIFNWRLDRELKRLEIDEKKANLKKVSVNN